MAYSRTADKLMEAKRLLADAFRTAEDEKLPQVLLRQIDTLTGKTEHLQNRILSWAASK